jgi:hypothetical protein
MKSKCWWNCALLVIFGNPLHAQEPPITPPESIVAEGVPKIPESIAETALH